MRRAVLVLAGRAGRMQRWSAMSDGLREHAFPDYMDEFGLVGPMPITDGQRQPLAEGEPTGPEIGTRLPDFTLPSAAGRTVSLHEDRGDSKAAVVFFRSAVW